MRHQVDGRKFGRNTSHRLAMFRNMANSVIKQEQVITSVQKAKEVRRVVDRLITLGKSGSAHSRRLAFDRTRDEVVVRKLFESLAERYKERKGGYTRVLKVSGRRWGDAAEMAILELVDHPELNRKRKVKAEAGDSAGAAEGSAAEKPARDPFKGFRRMFGGKSKVNQSAATKGGKAHSSGAGRKSPAGGGSSKAGGSSS